MQLVSNLLFHIIRSKTILSQHRKLIITTLNSSQIANQEKYTIRIVCAFSSNTRMLQCFNDLESLSASSLLGRSLSLPLKRKYSWNIILKHSIWNPKNIENKFTMWIKGPTIKLWYSQRRKYLASTSTWAVTVWRRELA